MLSTVLLLGLIYHGLDGVTAFAALGKTYDCFGRNYHAISNGCGGGRPLTFETKLAKHNADSASQSDDYDDFYADFDPAAFESVNNPSYEQSSSIRPSTSKGSSNRRPSNNRRHDYQRDAAADDTNVDVDAINQLIAERLSMRKTGRFDDADRIRNQLLDDHGVLIRDKDRMWRSGCSRSGSGLKWLKGGNSEKRGDYDRNEGDTARRGDFERKGGNRVNKGDYERKLGPGGHDYVMATNAGAKTATISEEEINRLLGERLAYKFSRDYDAADAIQAELVARGVFIDDKSRQWRADGRSFRGIMPNEYTLSDSSEEPDDASSKEIKSLINLRALLKAEALFKQSDDIRDELLNRFGVYIDDRSRQWSVGDSFGGEKKWGKTYIPYQIAAWSTVPNDVDEIQDLVEQRDTARVNREFDKADEIRNQLSERNILLNDKKRTWSVGVDDRDQQERRDVKYSPRSYTKRGGGEISESDLVIINELLAERDVLKQNRKFVKADTIRDELSEKFGISVDDRALEWHLNDSPYVMAHTSKQLDDDVQRQIQKLVEDRLRARQEKDFDRADGIRESLVENYGVAIDDRLREWYAE